MSIEAVAAEVGGVERVHGIRTRRAGAQSFVEMKIDVARTTGLEESHAIATAVEQAVAALLPRSDVIVHVDPVQARDESTVEAIHAIARRQNIAVHHISLYHAGGRNTAHLHIELPASLTIAAAHDRADAFEQQVASELSSVDAVVSHIEPIFAEVTTGQDVTDRAAEIVQLVQKLAALEGILECHAIEVQQGVGEYRLSCHCIFEDDANLTDVHTRLANLERRLRNEIPALRHIVLHPEPRDS